MFSPAQVHQFLLKDSDRSSPVVMIEGFFFILTAEGARCFESLNLDSRSFKPFAAAQQIGTSPLEKFVDTFCPLSQLDPGQAQWLAEFPSFRALRQASLLGGTFWDSPEGQHLSLGLSKHAGRFAIKRLHIELFPLTSVTAAQLEGLRQKQLLEALAKQQMAIKQAGIKAGCWQAIQDYPTLDSHPRAVISGEGKNQIQQLHHFVKKISQAGECSFNTLDELCCDLMASGALDDTAVVSIDEIRNEIMRADKMPLGKLLLLGAALDEKMAKALVYEIEKWRTQGIAALSLVRMKRLPISKGKLEKEAMDSYFLLESYMSTLENQYDQYHLLSPHMAKSAIDILLAYLKHTKTMQFNAKVMERMPKLMQTPVDKGGWLLPEQADSVLAGLRSVVDHLYPNHRPKVSLSKLQDFLKALEKAANTDVPPPLLSDIIIAEHPTT